MTFLNTFLFAGAAILAMMTILWLASIFLKNVSIVDLFWGAGFVLASFVYYFFADGNTTRKLLLLILVTIWGLRLSVYLAWRNIGKGEDYRYKEFRKNYGEKRYWWVSFFQTFLLQGVLMWIISLPVLAAMFYGKEQNLGWLDFTAVILWLIGIAFEAGGDFQLARFKKNPSNKGKVLNTGFWKYTRHPNYFGDAAVWWSYALFSIAVDSYWPIIGSIIMTFFLIKVSGVALLEKSLVDTKPQYREYIRRTSAFFPLPPKK
jgi:steroid 5-alpha reductase family enzyme